MGKALRYRLFGMGKMPPVLGQAAAQPRVLLAEEGISVHQSVQRLQIPRAKVRSGSKLLIGSLVLCPDRILAAVGKHPILDSDFRAPASPDALLALTSDGVRISFDVAAVVKDGSGSVQLFYKLALAETTLTGLPASDCPVTLTNVMPALLNGWKGTWAA